MAVDPALADLLTRARGGDQQAAAELMSRFSGRLAALARTRLGPLARGKVDPEDVVQSAFKSFFPGLADGRFAPEGWAGLWALLTTITLRKCGHHLDYLLAARRDVRREQAPPPPGLSDLAWEAIARDPTPSQAAILAETVEHVLAGLEGYHRDIFRLTLEGYPPAEIAEQVGVTERSVQRVLRHVRERVQRMAAG